MESQNTSILRHLQSGKELSQVLAYKLFGCWRLAARISNLRGRGFKIKTTMVSQRKKRFAVYKLEK